MADERYNGQNGMGTPPPSAGAPPSYGAPPPGAGMPPYGVPTYVVVNPNAYKKVHAAGLVGFIMGVVGIFLSFLLVVPLVGLIFSIIGMVKFDATRHKYRGFAIAGLVCSIVGVVYGVIQIVVLVFSYSLVTDIVSAQLTL